MPLDDLRSVKNHRPRHRAWIGVALAFYAFIAIGTVEQGLGVLIPSIQATYHLTPATITLLFLSQITGYIGAALASSRLSSQVGLAKMLLLAAISLTCALLIYAFTDRWLIMVAAGTLFGLGVGLIDAGINTYIASDQENADLTGFLHAFYGIGALMGPAIATTLLAFHFNWQQVYLVLAGVAGFAAVGMLWAVLTHYAPMNQRVTGNEARPSLRIALKQPIVVLSGLFLAVYVGTEAALGNWAYSVENVSRGVPTVTAGYSVSAYWLGLTIGRLGMGRVVKRWGANRTLNAALVLLAIGLLGWGLLPNAVLSLPLIGFALGPIFPLTIWLTPQRVSGAIVPAAIGFMTSAASLGAATIPTAIGWIAAQTSLGVIPVLMLPLAVLLTLIHLWIVQHTSQCR